LTSQLVHAAQAKALVVSLKVPTPHALHMRSWLTLAGPETYWPAKQSLQGVHEVAFAVSANVPAAHTVQTDALFASLNEPAKQALQIRFWLGEPATATYSPATQSVHGAQAVALAVSLYVPAAHALHVVALVIALKVPTVQASHRRSVTEEPAAATYSPAAQSLQAVHEIEPAVPVNVPAAHAVQVAALGMPL